MSTLEIAIASAFIAVAYAVVIAGEDTPFSPWFRWLDRMRDAGGWRSWIDIGTSEVSASLTSTGIARSSWIDIAALAKADVFVTIISDGGNGTADPEFSAAYFEVR